MLPQTLPARVRAAGLSIVFALLAGCAAPAASPTAAPSPQPPTVTPAAVVPTAAPTAVPAMDATGMAAMSASATPAPVPTSAGAAAAAAYPLTIQNCGRTLTFAKAPSRVVSLWQPQNEILLALGVQDLIVAMAGNYDDLPADLAQRAAKIKILGTSMAWPSKEVLLNEKPDLVVSEGLSGFMFDAAQGFATVAEIEATGAQVVSAGGNCNPNDPTSSTKSLATVYNDIAMFGSIFGVADRATTLIKAMKAKEAAVLDQIKGLAPVKVAFYNGGEGPLNVLTSGIYEEAMTKAGGQDVLPANVYQVSIEEFASAEPDVILVGTFPGQDAAPSIAFLKKTFPNIPAVKNNRFVPIAVVTTEASVRVIDGLESIAKGLHPEAFK